MAASSPARPGNRTPSSIGRSLPAWRLTADPDFAAFSLSLPAAAITPMLEDSAAPGAWPRLHTLVQIGRRNKLFALYQGTTLVVPPSAKMVRALAPATVKSEPKFQEEEAQGLK